VDRQEVRPGANCLFLGVGGCSMRPMTLCVVCAGLLGCGNQVTASHPTPPQMLEGSWRLVTAYYAPDPRTLNLSETALTVTGSGTAIGPNGTVPVSVTGNQVGLTVTLVFSYANGTARYTATFQTGTQLAGRAVYDSALGGMTDSLTYTQ